MTLKEFKGYMVFPTAGVLSGLICDQIVTEKLTRPSHGRMYGCGAEQPKPSRRIIDALQFLVKVVTGWTGFGVGVVQTQPTSQRFKRKKIREYARTK